MAHHHLCLISSLYKCHFSYTQNVTCKCYMGLSCYIIFLLEIHVHCIFITSNREGLFHALIGHIHRNIVVIDQQMNRTSRITNMMSIMVMSFLYSWLQLRHTTFVFSLLWQPGHWGVDWKMNSGCIIC